MFWRKRTFNDESLGELKFEFNSWSGKASSNKLNEILFDVAGSKEKPNVASLGHAKFILSNISGYVENAEKFITNQNLDGFTDKAGILIFDGFSAFLEEGSFDMQFGLSEWDDALIVVHYKNFEPSDISLGD